MALSVRYCLIMKVWISLFLSTALAVFVYAADVTGTWIGSFETQMGAMENTIVIKTVSPLAGTVATPQFPAVAMEDAKLEGDKISFHVTTDYGKVSYSGTVTADEMKLKVIGTQGTEYALICKRKK